MRGVIITWLIAEGIIVYRSVKVNHGPPAPGMLLATSGLFVLLAILGEAQPGLATMIGAGFDITGLLAPGILPGNMAGPVAGGKKGGGIQNVPNQPAKAGA